ncbi:MAG TPA: Crp/Fnr family transcriptional regulator [Hyphomicrobiaceae bacterium]|nr:Crp/Fnr family transcriptional regulator [Hyphomicrobiaceae bacterium]
MLTWNSCRDCAIRSDALCGAMQAEELAQLNRVAHRKRFRPGSVIMGNGEPPDWCANIVSGVIKLTLTLADGRQQIVGLLFPSDFLGRPYKDRSPYTAEAATIVELCCFSRRHFEQILEEQPAPRRLYIERTLDCVDAARDWMLLLGCKSAEERVATLILLIARRRRTSWLGAGPGSGLPPGQPPDAASQPLHFELPLSRTDMAEYLGLRIETVSRQLRRLSTAGIIATSSRRFVTVRDVAALERIVERPRG